jgi:zinc dependent phospholipase C
MRVAALLILVLLCTPAAPAYSVLTHEEVVDLLWNDEIRPLILSRYPGLTGDELREAHAYAYGGAVMPDLGYYPFGSKEFSDLLHYVRSGDFVQELLRESRDANEFAFALGALSHYTSDIAGHPAVNHSVALEYPKLRARFGPTVLFAQNKNAHLRTEFGFDTVQVAKHRYAPKQYHDFIGFKVSKPLLERTFPVVYGIELKEVLPHEDLAVSTFRFAVSQVIPEMTRVALLTHKKEWTKEKPDLARQKFLYQLSRAAYEKEWGRDYQRPGIGARILATVLRIFPKVGPLGALKFKSPTPKTEDLYIKSIDNTVAQYRTALQKVRTGSRELVNYDLDSGAPCDAAEYTLADDTYAHLLRTLAKRNFEQVTPELRQNLLRFYSDLSLPIHTKRNRERWRAVLIELGELRAPPSAPAQAEQPTALTSAASSTASGTPQ